MASTEPPRKDSQWENQPTSGSSQNSDWAAQQPRPADQANPPAPPGTHKHGPGFFIGILVIVLAVAAGTAWGVTHLPSEKTPSPSHTPSVTTAEESPATEPSYTTVTLPGVTLFDPIGDLDTPHEVIVVGIWADVAVFDLSYAQPGVAYPQGAHSILRGIDTHTGEILWTYASLPDDSQFRVSSFAANGGNLAMALENIGTSEDWGRDSIAGTQILALSLTTGQVLSTSYLEANFMETEDHPVGTYTSQRIIAYHNEVVVTDLYSPHLFSEGATITRTSGYRDNDLTSPLWEADGFQQGYDMIDGWFSSDRVLLDTYVLAASGSYVKIADGMPIGIAATGFDVETGHGFFAAGTTVIDTTVSQDGESVTSVSAIDPVTGKTTWTSTAPDKMSLWSVQCSIDNVLTIVSYDSATNNYRADAINLTNGSSMWSIPLPNLESQECSSYKVDDKPVFSFPASDSSAEYIFVDGTDGTKLTSSYENNVVPCGLDRACIIAREGDNSPSSYLTLSTITPQGLKMQWSSTDGALLYAHTQYGPTDAIFLFGAATIAVMSDSDRYWFESF